MTIFLTFDPPEPALLDAFEIALGYLVQTGQAEETMETQNEVARTLIHEWCIGKHNRIWLANKAIVAFEQKSKPSRR
jgi:hypothetical protein